MNQDTEAVENRTTTNKTNYKCWSFRLFIYLIFINVLVFYTFIKTTVLQIFDTDNNSWQGFNTGFQIFSVLGFLILIAGIAFTILSIINNEQKNYQYWISVFGYPLYLIVMLILNIR